MNYKKTWDEISELVKNTRGDAIRTGEYQDSTGKILVECTDSNDKDEIYDILTKKYPKGPKSKQDGTLTANNFQVFIKATTAKKTNWGYVTEGIIAIAIACRFLHKNSKITEKNYDDLLKELGEDETQLKKTSPNKNPDVLDDVFIQIDIPSAARESLYRKRKNKNYRLLVKSAINYANSKNVSIWSRAVYNNNRYDKIEVISIGKSGKKNDVKVCITDNEGKLKPVNINLSMKYSDIRQFGQAVGSDYETTNDFLKSIFGHEIDAKKAYNELVFKNEVIKAFQLSYKRIRNKIRTGIDPQVIVDGIKKHATGGDNQIKMLILGQKTKFLDFEKLNNWVNENDSTWKLIKEDFIVTYDEYGEGFPKLTIKLKGYDADAVLFSVRARKDQSTSKGNIVYRHYIEKGSLMDQLLGVKLEEE